jgi:hypothetical protein
MSTMVGTTKTFSVSKKLVGCGLSDAAVGVILHALRDVVD